MPTLDKPVTNLPWFPRFRDSILAAFKQRMAAPFWLWGAPTASLPTETGQGANEGAIAYDSTTGQLAYYDGSAWNEVYGAGTDAADARANLGLDTAATEPYAEGTFTPALKFGGASTGVTYSEQVGIYRRIGDLVFFTVRCVLTSKGSSTGSATITGLPFTSTAACHQTPTCLFADLTSVSVPQALIGAGSTTITLYNFSVSTVSLLQETNFQNGSSWVISGSYAI